MTRDDEAARADAAARLVSDVLEAAGALRRLGDEIAAAAGQTQARWQVLSVLSEGDWTVPRAARRLGVRRQSIQRVVDLLVAEGLARIEPNPEHARSPLVRLTERGRAVLATVTEVADPWHRRLAAEIPPEQLAAARSALAAVLRIARAGAGDGRR